MMPISPLFVRNSSPVLFLFPRSATVTPGWAILFWRASLMRRFYDVGLICSRQFDLVVLLTTLSRTWWAATHRQLWTSRDSLAEKSWHQKIRCRFILSRTNRNHVSSSPRNFNPWWMMDKRCSRCSTCQWEPIMAQDAFLVRRSAL